MISWNNPKFGVRELQYVKEVLKSGYVSEGPMTKKCEEQLALIVGTKHVIMTTSATAALYLAIEADKRIRKYESGEVVIPNLTFVATYNAVKMAGLTPKIVDVDKDDRFLMEPILPSKGIFMPVNLLGRDCGAVMMNGDTTIICDNAGCLGSKVSNGKVGCYSLQANKMLTCGQGGFCATDDDEYAKVIRQVKDFGRTDKYQNDTEGFNFKFNDIQAAVVLGQLEKLGERKLLLESQHKLYQSRLNGMGKFMEYEKDEIPLWVEFITDKRDALYEYLKANGVESRKPWNCFIQVEKDYPNSLYYQDNCLWLPNGPTLNAVDQIKIIKLIRTFYNGI